jgi:ubiquinone/menaquinone biosynthesis C-methylase UbiE
VTRKYDSSKIEKHFDIDPSKEWGRMETNPQHQVQFHIHTHYLKEYIAPSDKVFEIGSGPGRFTAELAKIGSKIAVADISSESLKLHKTKMKELGFEDAILWRKKLDIIDLSEIPDNSFDAAVAYGGPLSYVFEFASDALANLLRITKPGGYILLSVMASLGTWYYFVEAIFDHIHELGLAPLQKLFEDGDIIDKLAGNPDHEMHMFRWSELRDLIEKHPCEIVVASACCFMANNLQIQEQLEEEMKNEEVWNAFLQWELEFSREPGAVDTGTHLIVVLKNDS